MITKEEIRLKATDWSTLDPDQEATSLDMSMSEVARDSFYRGAEWAMHLIEDRLKKNKDD